MPKFITPRSYPLNDKGEFCSTVAEAAHREASQFGLTRAATRQIIQAFVLADGASKAEYEKAYGRCDSCFQDLPGNQSKGGES